MDYLYDGTFEGLLTCVYHHYYTEKATGIYLENKYQQDLIHKSTFVDTNREMAMKVSSAIYQKISSMAFYHINNVFFSNHPTKEMILLNYIVYGFKVGKKIEGYHTHPSVLPVHKISKQVGFEAHRFTGLLRFIEVGPLLYAGIEPDHNILPILAEHFIDRFKNENFMIHDTKRNIALIYNTKEWLITEYELREDLPISEHEKQFQQLWQGYFKHISIEDRENKALQQKYVPKKYRKYLSEFKGTYD